MKKDRKKERKERKKKKEGKKEYYASWYCCVFTLTLKPVLRVYYLCIPCVNGVSGAIHQAMALNTPPLEHTISPRGYTTHTLSILHVTNSDTTD